MSKILKGILIGISVFCIVVTAIAFPTVYDGYKLYKEAVRETSIEEKVSEIRQRSDYVKLNDISDEFLEGLVRSEDRRFRYHGAIDPIAIIRAAINDIKARSFVEGGSTITQQLAKNMYFDFNKNLSRKVAEVFTAINIEKKYSKDEILEMYCNYIYFGENCYGIKAAAEHYYDDEPGEISQYEADALVYTVKCPNCYNPNEKAFVAGI